MKSSRPHAYDLVVDTNHFENYSMARLGHTLAVHRQVQEKWHVPLVLGEWGAYFDQPETKAISEFHVKQIEANEWSQTYWSYYEGYFTSPTARVLERPYPQAINGKLHAYHYDPETQQFDLTYKAFPGTSRIFVPHLHTVAISQLAEQGVRADKKALPGSESGVLFITADAEQEVVLHLHIG
jgi:endoglycosylceramidase